MICPHCYSKSLRKNGRHHRKTGTTQEYLCKKCRRSTITPITNSDAEVIKENVKLAKQKQSYQDLTRIERKAFREHVRIENAVGEYTKELVKIFDKNKLHKLTRKFKGSNNAVGVVQLSDVHFNELVSLENNKYDFDIASKRCRYLANKSRLYFKNAKVRNVVIALTGDLMNSDRRLDELLNMATNRSKATFLAVDILQQMILDLNKDFNVTVACVSGNEGRVGKDIGWSDVLATDNYDWTIFNVLRYLFKNSNIQFIDGDPLELVINVAGQNLLLMHGNGSIKRSQVESSVNQIMGRYALRGTKIDYVIFGHIHSARVSDNFGRSASMVGANDYSEKALNLNGRASQNCYIFYNNGNRDGIKIDLQNTDCIGYNIDKSLESYNAKSYSKGKGGKVVFQVVV